MGTDRFRASLAENKSSSSLYPLGRFDKLKINNCLIPSPQGLRTHPSDLGRLPHGPNVNHCLLSFVLSFLSLTVTFQCMCPIKTKFT